MTKTIDVTSMGTAGALILNEEVRRLTLALDTALADYAMLRAVARRCFTEDASEQSMLDLWNIAAMDDHPGAPLIIRFNRAKAVAECWQRQPQYYDDCDPGQNDPYYAWNAEMNGLVASFFAALTPAGAGHGED